MSLLSRPRFELRPSRFAPVGRRPPSVAPRRMRAVAHPDELLTGLNPGQLQAATAVRGPVAILAGAGTGKTTTITHRIAYQVATHTWRADQILAVTFTEKAARELKARLEKLGVDGAQARTFHSAALAQLSQLWPAYTQTPLGDVLDAKGPLVASLANALPPPHKFLPRRELASEIEWAKNSLTPPDRYLDELTRTGHQPPIPPELMLRVYEGYERRKRAMQRVDFEDMLGLALRLFDEHPDAASRIHQRFLAFTVDEYQDVNPLQNALLERWLGGRDELCVVGDDYQTIYGFTGASPSYLLDFDRRFPDARIVALEQNYRSTPEILGVANRLAGQMGGFRKTLRAARAGGPAPSIHAVSDDDAEVFFVVDAVRRLSGEGVPQEEMAVLYRINARSEPFEEAFAAAGIPYQVRDGAFLRRPGPRAVLSRLRRESSGTPVPEVVARVTDALGFDAAGGRDEESEEEVTRQADLARLRSLAREFSEALPHGDLAAFLDELNRRFSTEQTGRGVNLMTYHRAKGLEFDAVFLPRLLEGELPFRSGRSRAPIEEERRLLYVGITRARTHLFATWPAASGKGRSPFLDEIEGRSDPTAAPARTAAKPSPVKVETGGPLFAALKRWRLERAKADGVPAYVVFHDATLAAIAERKPRSSRELRTISGVGPAKLERYGSEVLAVVTVGE
jgi:DNA helicase-2/ATP-dependent DNA helicase PcrA